MNTWERKIIDEFIIHYFASVPETGENRNTLRIISSRFFPGFDAAHHSEKESYIEAAKSLEQRGLICIHWEEKNERIKTLTCENFKMLFEETDRPYPKTEAEKIKAMLAIKTEALRKLTVTSVCNPAQSQKIIAFLEFISLHFSLREIGQGMDQQAMEEFVCLLEFLCKHTELEKITTRSLSILLYRDSKRLENILALLTPLLSRAQKKVPVSGTSAERASASESSPLDFSTERASASEGSPLDLSFLERSYPEIMISGKIIMKFKNSEIPMTNTEGYILGLPFESAKEIESIQPVSPKKEKTVLTIENKETFYALASPQKSNAGKNISRFNCFLYIGGYSNRAAAALIKTLAASDFTFYHAGDLDPDGVLILQNIQDIAERPVTPVRMDTATFDQYRPWARSLAKTMLSQIKKIRKETRDIEGIADLILRMEETSLGVEQEIIDYR